jgi:hypothetical protein
MDCPRLHNIEVVGRVTDDMNKFLNAYKAAWKTNAIKAKDLFDTDVNIIIK